MSQRMNDNDVLGPPRSCRRLPLAVWLWFSVALLVGGAALTLVKVVA